MALELKIVDLQDLLTAADELEQGGYRRYAINHESDGSASFRYRKEGGDPLEVELRVAAAVGAELLWKVWHASSDREPTQAYNLVDSDEPGADEVQVNQWLVAEAVKTAESYWELYRHDRRCTVELRPVFDPSAYPHLAGS